MNTVFWISVTIMVVVTYVPTIIKSYQTTKNDRRVINLEAEVKHLKEMVVIDVIYNPLITKFLSDAQRNGCEIISGIKMFTYQAAKQFELWTNVKIDVETMEEKVLENVIE